MKVSHLPNSSLIALAAVTLFAGCGRAEFTFDSAAQTLGQVNPPTVCAPGTPGTGTNLNGLAGSIKYLDDSQPRVSKVDDLLSTGHDSGAKLVLNNLSVPTINFSQGFSDPTTGSTLKRPDGTTLMEWFAFDLYSEIVLSDSESEGYYQLALLSDDGSTLSINATPSSAGTVLIDNDGTHPTQMGCANNAIYLKKNETLPIHLKYYEGPRYKIALTLVWRKVAGTSATKDASCGTSGDDLFWNSNVSPSAPTANYNDLVASGWKVPAAKNFLLPAGTGTNPCLSN